MRQSGVLSWASAAALVVALTAGQALAQAPPPANTGDAGAATAAAGDTAPKPKPKRRVVRAAPIVSVVVANLRAVALVELDAALTGSGDSVKIAGPLAPGKKVAAKVKRDKACLFDLHGVYEDASTTDVSGVELCKDKKINLVE